jgi:S-adenosylmethionine:tRNA ribosyltransferase-isomerase
MNIHPSEISIKDFTYDLPDDKIAYFPVTPRDSSKLLLYHNNDITAYQFSEITSIIPAESLLIFNKTKVIKARLVFEKVTGAQIECFCLEPADGVSYEVSFAQKESSKWLCLVGNAKKWKEEILTKRVSVSGIEIEIKVEKLQIINGEAILKFSWNDRSFSFSEIIEAAGLLPLPPYIKRDANEIDDKTYNTVYAKEEGSVAAPTAGLHFTEEVLENLQSKKVNIDFVTLHVGAGTFKPVKADVMKDHLMHSEWLSIPLDLILRIKSIANIHPIIAVGTTAIRSLESIYWWGVKLLEEPEMFDSNFYIQQWDPYSYNALIIPSVEESLSEVIRWMKCKNINAVEGYTQIIISPGYEYKIVDALITNFHQPQSTLLLLVAALVGDDWKKIYEFALKNNFRFLSYGDSSLLFKKGTKFSIQEH